MNRSSLVGIVCFLLLSVTSFGKVIPDSLSVLVKWNPNKALKLLDKNKGLYKNDLRYYYLLASAKQNLGQYVEVDSMLDQLLKQNNIRADSALYFDFLLIDAENNKILDRFEEAFSLLTNALMYRERHRDTLGIIDLYITMAEYFRASANFEYALSYLNKADGLSRSIPRRFPPLMRARMINRRAAIYLEEGRYLDSVELFSKEVIRIGRALKDENQVATASNELGFLYFNTGRPEAEAYFKQALGIWETLDYKIYANNVRLNLARLYARNGNPNKAIAICNDGLKNITLNQWDWEEGYSYEVLSIAYGMLGDFRKSARYAVMAKEKMLFNARGQYKSRLAYYINKLELREKQAEISRKNLEVVFAQQEVKLKSKENDRLLLFLVLSCVVILATSGAIFGISRQKRKVSEQKAKTDKIKTQLENLLVQKEVLLKEVNHRVKNNLGLLAGLMYLKEKELHSEEAIKSMRDMQGRINTISLIHENLYQRDDMEFVDFHQYLGRLSEQIIQVYSGAHEVKVQLSCEGFKPQLSLAISLSMMINELMTNSLKHAFEGVQSPEIHISYNKDPGELTYWDNGPGYDTGKVVTSLGKNLLDIFARQIRALISFEMKDSRLTTKITFAKS